MAYFALFTILIDDLLYPICLDTGKGDYILLRDISPTAWLRVSETTPDTLGWQYLELGKDICPELGLP